ncbi:MAG: anti-sigma factor [Bacteroidetes bacterium]|nr:anti-sigma factor [Bacteroidota bacterium]MBU1115140.1 anti-sigma factor [Bacteroidota bacterium]MBU1799279.1 anti-sigma factor [Bacteroidota bacterium]
MADDAIKEMISAFALGCMDKTNFKQFRSYFENNGKLPAGELGDLQNIISLIPTILNIDTPNEELKNELGKRLIQIQKDLKNNVIENRRETRIVGATDFVQRNSTTKIFDVNEKRMEGNHNSINVEKPKQSELKTLPKKNEKITRLNTTTIPVKKSSNLNIILLWVFSGILLIALAFISYTLLDRISILDEKNLDLTNKLVKLRTDLLRTDDFVNQNMEFVEFFNNPSIDIIALKSTNPNSKESGKLFTAFGSGEGLLQLQNMPHLDADMTFQLWLVSKSGTFSLGTFEIRPDKKYMRISEIPFVMKDEIEMFRITKEKKEGTFVPTGETILFGALRNEQVNKKR